MQSTVACDWVHCSLRLCDVALSLASGSSIDWFYCSFLLTTSSLSAPADLSSSADHDDVTDDIIIIGPLGCSSWFPSSLALAAGSYRSSWFTMLQLVQLGLRVITNN
ncbi:hypothetical protein F511_40597 [Dorcoceras hygrometricum]|uniref:Uncharacterized protein n=1 Tax=Dorcoceras hygrometricum TaxID=472368 RepID=A0A2Z7ARJ5_9LAMI|nr:hypothetical protein F511_40597 [Dorcoceras hygrometricum]